MAGRSCLQVFLTAIQLFLEERGEDVGAAVFDKDDDLAVEFVAAAANLRSIAYHIPTQSLFAAKAGLLLCMCLFLAPWCAAKTGTLLCTCLS